MTSRNIVTPVTAVLFMALLALPAQRALCGTECEETVLSEAAGPGSGSAVSAGQEEKPVVKKEASAEEIPANERLAIIWTSGDREVALKMVFMYTFNSKKFGWWKDITLVVWGPSAKLLSEDAELQEYIAKIKEAGVHLKACKGCSDLYGVSDKLAALGIEVKYMGEITDYIKEGRHVLTF
ncbi:MAG TPA: DsrE family protein [Candidatus Krumholzibacterium sp.]|nr:DsrE family protein [Candidatus Krumholzibacterium sp.]